MTKIINVSGKRKRATARVTIRDGSGKVTINRMSINAFQPKLARMRVTEPLVIAGDIVNSVDIDISVHGGGITSQAEASRLGIGKALVAFSKSKKLKDEFLNYDRHLLVADVRRKESAKPNSHSQARAKRQKSYR